MNATKRLESQNTLCIRLVNPSRWRERINTIARCARIVAVLLMGASAGGYAEELPRPGEAIDASDSYQLKDGSRVALHRVVNEVVIETCGDSPNQNTVYTPLYA